MTQPLDRPSGGVTGIALDALLRRLSIGTLEVTWPDGHVSEYRGRASGPAARITITDRAALSRIATGGGIGFAEAYMDGQWDSPDLGALLDLGLLNVQASPLGWVPTPLKPVQRTWHRLRANTRSGSRRNIAYHYNLGNEFYRLWLDDTMTYSSALFAEEGPACDEGLACAQRRKWDRLLDLIQPGSRDRLLEIGCGWGGFAVHAAKEAGCRVLGVTLSEEQHAWATRRVAEEGLEGRVEIRLQDYRDIPGTFTGIASIEMFEAVGEKYWPLFFGRVSDLLGRGGRAAIQTITIADESFDAYRANPDFIQRYIFPGGMLPSPERFARVAREAGLEVEEPHFFGECYAATLERWLERFELAADDVRALGFDERFVRMWRYYLAYCRTGFRNGNVDVMQVALER